MNALVATLILLSGIVSIRSYAEGSQLTTLMRHGDGILISGQTDVMIDPEKWSSSKAKDAVVLTSNNKFGNSDAPIVRFEVGSDAKKNAVTYYDGYGTNWTNFEVWSARLQDNRVASITFCETHGCHTVTKNYCEKLQDRGQFKDLRDMENAFEQCRKIDLGFFQTVRGYNEINKELRDEARANIANIARVSDDVRTFTKKPLKEIADKDADKLNGDFEFYNGFSPNELFTSESTRSALNFIGKACATIGLTAPQGRRHSGETAVPESQTHR